MKMKKWMMGFVGAAALMMAAGSAKAAVILTFDFTGTNPGQSTPWSTTSTKDADLNIVTGWTHTGTAGNAGNNRFNANNWSTAASYSASGAYISVTIQAAPGNRLDLSGQTLSFTLQNSGTGPDFYSVRSSFDSYAASLSAASAALNAAGATTATSLTLPSTVGWDNITSSITFRIYGWGASSAAGTMSINAFTLNGDVLASVPEPSTYALVGAGLAGLVVLRLRRGADKA